MGNWKIAEGCKYARTDEWIRADGQEAIVGITDYAQNALSDLVFLELPKVGAVFSAGQVFCVVESVKAAADVNIPVSGEIKAINNDLVGAPELTNQDAFGNGWLVRIKMSNSAELDNLMDASQYAAYCDERG